MVVNSDLEKETKRVYSMNWVAAGSNVGCRTKKRLMYRR